MKTILTILCLSIMIYYSNNIPYKQGTLIKNLRNLQGECEDSFEFNGECIGSCQEMNANSCTFFPLNDPTKICKKISGSCQITDRTCEEMEGNNCRALILTNDKICARKINEYKCEERAFTCVDIDINNCASFTPIDVTMKCILGEVVDELEDRTCKEVKRECPEMNINHCQDLEVSDFNKKCFINSEGNACELTHKICSDYKDSNCGNYIPLNQGFKCIKEESAAACKEVAKNCSELNDKCEDAILSSSTKKCVLNEITGKCEEVPKEEETIGNKSQRIIFSMGLVYILLLF